MQDTAKYLIHANITADGVVERSDVVGAVFGQTEGLLGDELDLRDLQDSSKIGRIDVDIDSANGQSFGEITIATSLDKVETAILAAALETIDRVGPCRSTVEVDRIEDVRAAKRREVVERAKRLLAESFEGSVFSSDELVEEVRRSIRVDDITEYEGLPAGPRVAESDAIVVVEGRADVITLLRYGVKNAVAVEGTNVPEAIAELTRDRTVTAFLDGDRGGELILRELAQVGEVDYVAFAPESRSVEDLERHEVMAALRGKVPYDSVSEEGDPRRAATDPPGGAADTAADPGGTEAGAEVRDEDPGAAPAGAEDGAPDTGTGIEASAGATADPAADAADRAGAADGSDGTAGTDDEEGVDTTADGSDAGATGDAATDADGEGTAEPDAEPSTLRGHARAVVDAATGRVRLLDAEFATLSEAPAGEAFEAIRDADAVPAAVVLDGELSQRILDVAAQRGVEEIVARSTGDFVKRPTDVRVRTADRLLGDPEEEAAASAGD